MHRKTRYREKTNRLTVLAATLILRALWFQNNYRLTVLFSQKLIYGFGKTRNDGIFRGTLRGTFFKNFRDGLQWSKYTYEWVIAYSERYFSPYKLFWKARNFRRNSAESFKMSENWFETFPNGPNIPFYEFEDLCKCPGGVLSEKYPTMIIHLIEKGPLLHIRPKL